MKGYIMKLKKKTKLEQKFIRYDIGTKKYHNFFANGILVHNCNARHAFIDGEFMAGSHNMRLKENPKNKFWHIFSDNMKALLQELGDKNTPVIMYGELFGDGIQDLKYGLTKGQIDYRCFDIKVNGHYLNYNDFREICIKHDIKTVPYLYSGSFSFEKIMELSNNHSNLGNNIMEGIVIKPYIERVDPKIRRVVLKYVFDQYYQRKGGSEFK